MFEELYEARFEFDLRRQPSYGRFLFSYDQILRNKFSKREPYNLLSDQQREFSEVLRGEVPSDLVAVGRGALFRLASLNKLLHRPGIQRRPDRISSKERIFEEALKDFENAGSPLPLTWAIQQGCRLEGLRRIDFWTDLDLRSGDLERNAYLIGLPRNWFPVDDPIVLICPVRTFVDKKAGCELRIPTILDGYDFGPFCAISEIRPPQCGLTLDLYDPENLQLGVAEFVSSSLPVENISFIPMRWSPGAPASSLERSFQANSPLLQNLVDYFRKGM